MEARPPASACAAGAPLLMAKAGGKPAGRGISISPALHPPLETTNQGGLGPPIGCTPRGCPTGNSPAAEAYFVTPPPLGAGVKIGAPAATQRSGRRGERRPSGGNELSGLPGSERSVAWADDVGRGILDAPFPSRHKHHSISAAWHRRRPGGPSRYSAALCRACRVTAMRAARGAAAPVT